MATSSVRPALGPIGKTRRPGIMALLYVVTGGFYFVYWLYKTIQELRAHSPGCTSLEWKYPVPLVPGPLFRKQNRPTKSVAGNQQRV